MTTPADLPHDDFDPATPHKPADDREEIYFQGSPLLRGSIGRLVFSWLLALLLALLPVVWKMINGQWPIWWISLVCLVLAVLVLCVPVLFTRSLRYRISNYRIDYERGILGRRIDTMEL